MKMRRGFTLIELLVVIAIIGILAAMLFPVFARARESARKIQCLSNVKNIAMAVQMYLSDYDSFPPDETNQAMYDYWAYQGQFRPWGASDCSWMPIQANPYLRWPVIFDEYIKNRDVWRCPSARILQGASFIIPIADYFRYWVANEGVWGNEGRGGIGYGPCARCWPSGWGGTVTDSLAQGGYAAEHATGGGGKGGSAAFVQGISAPEQTMKGVKISSINDAAATPVCADGGVENVSIDVIKSAYPDVCALPCVWPGCCQWGGYPGPPDDGSALTNISVRKQYARHLGGINVGFADGHARWFDSEMFMAECGKSRKGELSAVDATYAGSCGSNTVDCPPECCPASTKPGSGLPHVYLY